MSAVEGAGGRAVALQADVSDADAARELVERCERELGDLDVLVCNAGVTRDGLIARLSPEAWTTVIDTNLAGPFFLCQAVSRRMMRRRSGSIVLMSSVVVGALALSRIDWPAMATVCLTPGLAGRCPRCGSSPPGSAAPRRRRAAAR